jgi:NADH:ubiquinone oxidoreductase subunit 6 (subunit J)
LCAAGAFAGLAMIYLQLDAEFVGFAQLLVYVGAIAILIVFAVLLTRGAEVQPGRGQLALPGWGWRCRAGAGVFDGAIWPAPVATPGPPPPDAPVKKSANN